jgi:hypothetical protein
MASARFIRQAPPSHEEVADVVSGVEHRLTRVLSPLARETSAGLSH